MKLKHDCVRKTLLFLEENLTLNTMAVSKKMTIDGFSTEDITYTIQKLSEANFIVSKYVGYDGIQNYTVSDITWYGHQFLDNIRDDNVWKNTKKILSKFSSTSLSIVENVSAQVITNLIKSSIM